MFTKLASFGSPKAIGIYFDGETAHACVVTATPLGLKAERRQEAIDFEKPAIGIERLIARLNVPSRQLPVAIGLPIDRTYFTTRPIHLGGGDATPRVLLREALRSSSVPIDDMLVDVVTSQPGNRDIASIVSCDRKFVEKLATPLLGLGLRLRRAEPAPNALLRAALKQDRTRRRSKVVCRMFLSETHLLAILTAKDQPILWRSARMPRGDEATAILAMVRSLGVTGEQSGLETQPEVVVLHGRKDLPRLLDMDWMREQLDIPLYWLEGPAFSPEVISQGLAESCFEEEVRQLDLSRTIKAEPSWRELFPWRDAVLCAAVLLVMTAFLTFQWSSVAAAHATTTIRNTQCEVASLSTSELQREKQELETRVNAVHDFLESRVVWTNYARSLADLLPENIFLTSIQGDAELPKRGKSNKKAKRQLVITGAISIAQDGLIPHEVDSLLDTLRSHPTLTSDFPVIELAELKQFRQPQESATLAMFTIICLPKGAKKVR